MCINSKRKLLLYLTLKQIHSNTIITFRCWNNKKKNANQCAHNGIFIHVNISITLNMVGEQCGMRMMESAFGKPNDTKLRDRRKCVEKLTITNANWCSIHRLNDIRKKQIRGKIESMQWNQQSIERFPENYIATEKYMELWMYLTKCIRIQQFQNYRYLTFLCRCNFNHLFSVNTSFAKNYAVVMPCYWWSFFVSLSCNFEFKTNIFRSPFNVIYSIFGRLLIQSNSSALS